MTHTYAEHFDEIARAIGGLRRLGIGRGDRFALMMANSPEYLVLFQAALLGGGVVNPLNLRFAPKELAYVLKDSGSTVCFVDQHFAGLIDSVKEEAGLEHVILVGGGDGPHTMTYADFLASGEPVIPEEGEESDPVVLMYTGGTTGLPKGVLSNQRGQMMNLYHCLIGLPYERGETFLLQTPMFHAASTLTMTSMPVVGGHIVTVPMFEPVGRHARDPCVRTTLHGDGADDDRDDALASGLRARGAGTAPAHRIRRLPDAPGAAREVGVPVPGLEPLAGLRHDRGVTDPDDPATRGPPCGRPVAAIRRRGGDRRRAVDPRLPTTTSSPSACPAKCVHVAATTWSSTGTSPRRPTMPSPAAGTTRVMRGTSMPTGTCIWSTG